MVMSNTTVDCGAKALEVLQQIERAEPHLAFEPNYCRVLVRTAMQPISFQKVGELKVFPDRPIERTDAHDPMVTWDPPNSTFIRRFTEPEPLLRIDRLHTTAERIRNHLAFAAGFPVPVVAIVESKEFLRTLRLESDPTRYALPSSKGMPTVEEMAGWSVALRHAYQVGQTLLEEISPNEPKGRALSLLGEAIWAEDAEERFFYAWRSLEVIATYDLAAARQKVLAGDLTGASPYLSRKAIPIVSEQNAVIDPSDKVAVSVYSRVPETPTGTIERYYELRNDIAHGTVSPEAHLEILKAAGAVTALAHRIASSLIGREEHPSI